MVLLSRVEETVFYDGWPHALACNEYPDAVFPQGYRLLRAFSNEPFPRWAYQNEGWTLEKQLRLLNGSNARIYKLAWSDGSPMRVIGTDGGLVDELACVVVVSLRQTMKQDNPTIASNKTTPPTAMPTIPANGSANSFA